MRDDCVICCHVYDVHARTCEKKADGKCKYCFPIECDFGIGMCGHIFHFHCISQHLRHNDWCPIDNTVWEWKKYVCRDASYEKFFRK